LFVHTNDTGITDSMTRLALKPNRPMCSG